MSSVVSTITTNTCHCLMFLHTKTRPKVCYVQIYITLNPISELYSPCSDPYVYRIHTHTLNGSFSRTTWVSRYQKDKTNLDFTEARDSEWQWHQLGHMQVCTLLQTDNHASTPPLKFLQAGCPSCRPTNSFKALKDSLYLCNYE